MRVAVCLRQRCSVEDAKRPLRIPAPPAGRGGCAQALRATGRGLMQARSSVCTGIAWKDWRPGALHAIGSAKAA